ncbi:MAG: ATP-binding cassette domain-containing protein [Oceanospirillales bacterium]|nr:ATP-binding cassette domain-containing protein [Oceanospirillales bacterium]
MTDLDQTIDKIAAENSHNRHQDLALGTAEAGFAIAIAIWIAMLFSPPLTAPDSSMIIVLMVLVLARRIASDWWFQRSERLGQQTLTDYRSSFSKAVIQRLPSESSGAVGALAIEGTEPVAARLGRYPTLRALAVIQPILVVIAMGYIHWPVAVGILITTPLIPLLMALIGVGAKSASQKQVDALTRLGAHYLDRIRGLETLWMLGGARDVGAEIEEKADQLRQSTMGVLKLAFLTSAVLEFFSALAIAMIAVYVGLSLLNLITPLFGLTITPLEGLCLLILAPEFYSPIRRLMAAWHDASEAKSADEKVKSMLGTQWKAPSETPPVVSTARLALTQYSVGFDADKPLIEAIDLVIPVGERCIIFGPSGSGKSQFLGSLLNGQARLSGSLQFDTQPIHALTDIREQVAWMGQAQWFDEGDIKQALSYGNPVHTDSQYLHVLNQVGLLEQLGSDPLNRHLGPRGAGLSGGQLRRLGLARALLRQPQLLILDEPTAHLDADSADQLAHLIRTLDTTCLLVTHDHRFDSEPMIYDLVACRLERRP